MPGSPNCPPSTSCPTVLLARRACDNDDLAEDELRTLVVLVTDNKQLTLASSLVYVMWLQPSVSFLSLVTLPYS